jgi:hypothetical protein
VNLFIRPGTSLRSAQAPFTGVSGRVRECMGGEGAAAVGEWAGMVVGWVREQAVVVGLWWSSWSEEVGGEGACMGGR